MSDYMKEAERLLNDFALLVQMNVAGLASMAQLAEARAALLAHIQRGAVPEGERAAFESWIENEAGAGAARRWLNTEAYENGRVQDYRTGWIACLEWLAAPAPDHFRDTAKMVPAQPRVETFDVDFLARLGAEVPAPAEVPMPECYVTSGGRDLFSEEQMSTYGDTRAAAGYARCLREMLDCRTCRNYTRDGCIQTAQCVDGDGYRRAIPVRFWSAALRGEGKP